ncbi:MAG: hypothetical protein ACR2PL_04910, partial [Dehalococcoidia bacterium]
PATVLGGATPPPPPTGQTPSFGYYVTGALVPLVAGLLAGVAIAEKSWPALVLPVLLTMAPSWRARVSVVAGAAVVVCGCLLIYGALLHLSPLRPLESATGYRGYLGTWGVSLVVGKLGSVWPPALGLRGWLNANGAGLELLALATGAVWTWRRRQSERDCLLLILISLAVAGGWGFHWLVWPLAFAALADEERARVYTILGSVHYILIYFIFGGVAWGFTHFTRSLNVLNYTWPLSLPLWLFVVWWAIRLLSPRSRVDRRGQTRVVVSKRAGIWDAAAGD